MAEWRAVVGATQAQIDEGGVPQPADVPGSGTRPCCVCKEPAWLGPQGLLLAELPLHQVWCIGCIVAAGAMEPEAKA